MRKAQALIDQAECRTPHYVARKYKTHLGALPQLQALQAVAVVKPRVVETGYRKAQAEADVQHRRGERCRKAPVTRPVRAMQSPLGDCREAVSYTAVPAPDGFRKQ